MRGIKGAMKEGAVRGKEGAGEEGEGWMGNTNEKEG